MKAVYIQSYGGFDSVVVGERPTPDPGPGEVRIKMAIGGLNRVDLYMLGGGRGITHELPLVLGVDGTGIVDVVGEGVADPAPGTRVVVYPARFCGNCEFCRRGDQMLCMRCKIPGEHIDGCFAQYLIMPAGCVFPIADTLSFEHAAVLPTSYLTAWRMVTTQGRVKPADTVLIHGIGGGVSSAALLYCRMIGARTIVTSSSDSKLTRAAELGADICINYREQDVVNEVLRATDKRGVDVVLENVGKATWDVSMKCVIRGGRIVVCGATTGGDPSADLQRVFIRQLRIYGATIGNQEEFRRLIRAAEQKRFEPVIERQFDMDEAAAGLARLDSGEQFGKITLRIDP